MEYKDIVSDLRRATVDSKHPYRYAGLSTVNQRLGVLSRTVVLRKLIDDNQLLVYSDSRTQKVEDLASDNRISLLCYNPQQRSQIRINGTATIITSGSLYDECLNNISPYGINDYNSVLSPGSNHTQGTEILKGKKLYFSVISIQIQYMDYLKIDTPEHYRASFFSEGGQWKEVRLIP